MKDFFGMRVSYRFLAVDDIKDVVKINNLAWKHKEEKVTEKQVRKRIINNPTGHIVAEVDEKIVGVIFSVIIETGGDFLKIPVPLAHLWLTHNPLGDTKVCYSVSMLKEYRGLGIAKGLILAQKALVINEGLDYLITFSPADEKVESFHEHLGAKKVWYFKDGRYQGKDAMIMQYDLEK